jgi:hypothetical protein
MSLVLAGIGLAWILARSLPRRGRWPGDYHIEREDFRCYFPLGTCQLLSRVWSRVVWVIRPFRGGEQPMDPRAGDKPTYLYRITPDDRIEFVNDAWIRFAEENGAPALPQEVLDTSLWQHISGPAVVHLSRHLVAKVRQTHTEVALPFRCDSPWRRRFLRMRIVPLTEGRIEFCTWVEREEPFPKPIRLLDPCAPRNPADLIRMCAWYKRIDKEGCWLEVEDAIEQLRLFDRRALPAITHGICDSCLTRLGTYNSG